MPLLPEVEKNIPLYYASRFKNIVPNRTIFNYFPTSFHPNQAIRTFALWQII